MSVPIEEFHTADKRTPMRDIVAGLQATLERNHLKILEAARSEWERKHTEDDPSDSCATIKVAQPSTRMPKRMRANRLHGRN